MVVEILFLLAFWPVWKWQIDRAMLGSNDCWTVAALAILLLAAGRMKLAREMQFGVPVTAVLLLAIYIVSFDFVPWLVRGLLAILAVTSFMWSRFHPRARLALAHLALLSLPITASLDFFLSYPLRKLSGLASANLLTRFNYPTHLNGITLSVAGTDVLIDAPCAGISFLWTGLLFTATVAALYKIGSLRTLFLFIISILGVIVANICRISVLALMEASRLPVRHDLHETIGLSVFIIFCIMIVAVAWACAHKPERQAPVLAAQRTSCFRQVLVCHLAVLAIFFPALSKYSNGTHNHTSEIITVTPPLLRDSHVKLLPITDREQRLLATFPGRVGRFSGNGREIIYREVFEATRKLHPASHCFQGLGFDIEYAPALSDSNSKLQGCFRAIKDLETYRVCESIRDKNGTVFSDVSSWYWHALFHPYNGPWTAITIAEAEDGPIGKESGSLPS